MSCFCFSSAFTNWLIAFLIGLAGCIQLRAQPAPVRVSTPVSQTGTETKRIASKAAIVPDQPISMVILSDTQLHWWRAATDPDCSSPACVKQQGRRTNFNMLNAIRNINSLGAWPTGAARKSDVARINQTPAAISLNGDLTNYFHPDEFADYQEFWDSGQTTQTIYPGLGNHDYYNNTPTNGSNPPGTPDCGTPACAGSTFGRYSPDYWRNAKEAVWYMANKLTDGSLPNVVNRDLGGYISLHNTAGFNIRLTISYRLGGLPFTRTSGGFDSGRWRAFPVPRGATQVSMTVEKNNGINWVLVGTVNNLLVTRNCFKVQGTLANTTLAQDDCRREWPTDSEGSLSYSYEIGKYHFVQLHLSPNYEVNMIERPLTDDLLAAYNPGKSPGFTIIKSYSWLRNDLVDATARGKIIVIHVHSDSGYGGVFGTEFDDAIADQNVIAVFSGHLHEQWGVREGSSTSIDNGRNTVRFFRSGGAEAERMLYAEFHDSYYNVGVVKTNNGIPVFNSDPNDEVSDMGENFLNPMDLTYRWSNTSLITQTGQPSSQAVCSGNIIRFAVGTTNAATQFQWQVDANTGRFEDVATTDTRFSGITSATLTISNPTSALAGFRFRVRVQNDSGELTTSDGATLTIRPTTPPPSLSSANRRAVWGLVWVDGSP